jgi:hypothetical protein
MKPLRHFNTELKTLSLFSLFALIFLLSASSAAAQAVFTTDEAEFNSNNVLIIQDFQDGSVAPGGSQVCIHEPLEPAQLIPLRPDI